jgi:predicted O-methyltransferase YrrM
MSDVLALADVPDLVHLDDLATVTSQIASMTSAREAQALFFLSALPAVAGDVVEIGSWRGYSTVHLAAGCRWRGEGMVHAIDHFRGAAGREAQFHAGLGPGETILDRLQHHLREAGVADLVRIHNADSMEARREIEGPVRLLFVDGCHEYGSVRRDLDLYQDLLPPGGWVACHDFSPDFPGSVRATKEMLIHSGGFDRFFLTHRLFVARKK